MSTSDQNQRTQHLMLFFCFSLHGNKIRRALIVRAYCVLKQNKTEPERAAFNMKIVSWPSLDWMLLIKFKFSSHEVSKEKETARLREENFGGPQRQGKQAPSQQRAVCKNKGSWWEASATRKLISNQMQPPGLSPSRLWASATKSLWLSGWPAQLHSWDFAACSGDIRHPRRGGTWTGKGGGQEARKHHIGSEEKQSHWPYLPADNQ